MLIPLFLLALSQGSPAKPPPDLYRRTVGRALERVQSEIRANLVLDVNHSRWEDPWVVASAHYEVRSTHSYKQASEIARDLEFMHAEFVKLLGEGVAHEGPRRVWIFPNMTAYNAFGETAAEHSSLLGSFYAGQQAQQPVATYQIGNRTWLGMWITHSALHQYLEQGFGTQRFLWVEEGLASYFALFWDWEYGARELERIEKGRTFIPLERIVSDPIAAYAVEPDDRFIELGMLFHFLLNSCEATRDGATGDPTTGPFREFLRAAVRGQDVSASEFLQTFEEASDLLEEEFRGFDFSKR